VESGKRSRRRAHSLCQLCTEAEREYTASGFYQIFVDFLLVMAYKFYYAIYIRDFVFLPKFLYAKKQNQL